MNRKKIIYSVSNPTKDQETSTIFDELSESSKISNELKKKIIGKSTEEENNLEGNNENTDDLDQDISEIMMIITLNLEISLKKILKIQ